VLTPRGHRWSPFITIPTGVTAILASNGADKGDVPPGTHICPPWVRCIYMVPNQACTYNYDVMSCPTKDNVMVEVDVTIVFRITNARNFCFNLGAHKFDQMLKAVCEESIRSMVRAVEHKVIYELRGGAENLLTIMNGRFQQFGVVFVNSNITNVLLPDMVAGALQRITQLSQNIKEHNKRHEFELKRQNDEQDLVLQELCLQNEREEAELEAEKVRLAIDLERNRTEMEKKKEISIIKAEEQRSVGMRAVNARLVNEKIEAETRKEAAIQNAHLEAKKMLLETEHWSENKKIASEAELIEAENRAKVLILEGDAENKAADRMKESRQFGIKMRTAEVLKKIAARNRILINGSQGGNIISSLVGGKDLDL